MADTDPTTQTPVQLFFTNDAATRLELVSPGNPLPVTIVQEPNVTQQAGTAYTFDIADANGYIQFTNGAAITATIPTNASVPFAIGTTITIEQAGAGVVTVAATGGVTLHSNGGMVDTNGQYAVAEIVKVATDTWTLFGNLA